MPTYDWEYPRSNLVRSFNFSNIFFLLSLSHSQLQKNNAKNCLSEMGSEPMPLSRTKSLLSLLCIAEQELCLESGALDHSAILTSYWQPKQFLIHLGIEPRTFGLEVQRAILCANGSCYSAGTQKKAIKKPRRNEKSWFLAERSFDLRTSGLWA